MTEILKLFSQHGLEGLVIGALLLLLFWFIRNGNKRQDHAMELLNHRSESFAGIVKENTAAFTKMDASLDKMHDSLEGNTRVLERIERQHE